MRKIVGANFRRLRNGKDWTQETAEEHSGFSQQYISELEKGKRNPTIVSLFHLAQAIGVTPVELVSPLTQEDYDKIMKKKSKVSKETLKGSKSRT